MNLDDLTLGEAKKLVALLGPGNTSLPDHPFPVGEAVFIRAVTFHYTGRLVRVTAGELVLTEAAWIADDGRSANALATGILDEIEPYPDGEVIVLRGVVSDVCRWPHALPRAVK